MCCLVLPLTSYFFFFFFNDTATTEIYTLSLHDALPISSRRTSSRPDRSCGGRAARRTARRVPSAPAAARTTGDRKSTRLNSSHSQISYAVFCLKKKKNETDALQTIKFTNYYSGMVCVAP